MIDGAGLLLTAFPWYFWLIVLVLVGARRVVPLIKRFFDVSSGNRVK
nr:hypothetical protein [Rhodococcus sp. ARP2]